jgi:dihydrolipoamide dehydrogenase
MSKQIEVDVVVVGGGPGGYTAAFRAADLGLSVCLVEQRKDLGGVCLHEGCIPSKTLLHGASLVEMAEKGSDYGVCFTPPKVDVDVLRNKKKSVTSQLVQGLGTLAKARNVLRINGTGYFEKNNTLQVAGDEPARIRFSNAVIATGSLPFMLPGLPEDPRIWNSTAALSLETIPKRLLIIGGGIIGLEMAQVYHALGTKITIVEMLAHIIPPADRDIIQPLFLRLKKRYTIYTQTELIQVTANKTDITVSFSGKKAPENAEFDAVLVAVGRRPNSLGLGLEEIGVRLDTRGFIEKNERQQTSIPHIYAVGDVAGEPMLAHKATHEAKVAAENIAGKNSVFAPATIPSVAYTEPEIAWMGLTEKEAKAKKIPCDKGKFPWGASGRALSTDVATGVTKALFDPETGKILGAAICGAHAGELIHEAVLALEQGATAADLSKTIHAHPTLAETFAFAAELVHGSITDTMPQKKKK